MTRKFKMLIKESINRFRLFHSTIVFAKSFLQSTTNIKSEMRSFKSNENIHKKEGGSYYVVSANKASSVTL